MYACACVYIGTPTCTLDQSDIEFVRDNVGQNVLFDDIDTVRVLAAVLVFRYRTVDVHIYVYGSSTMET